MIGMCIELWNVVSLMLGFGLVLFYFQLFCVVKWLEYSGIVSYLHVGWAQRPPKELVVKLEEIVQKWRERLYLGDQ